MQYGNRVLKSGCEGEDVQELQIRLSGFSGGAPDGDYGSTTIKSVQRLQEDYMEIGEFEKYWDVFEDQ